MPKKTLECLFIQITWKIAEIRASFVLVQFFFFYKQRFSLFLTPLYLMYTLVRNLRKNKFVQITMDAKFDVEGLYVLCINMALPETDAARQKTILTNF